MDWSFVPGVDLTRDPVVTAVDGGRLLTWPGCRAFLPAEALGKAEPDMPEPNGCRSRHGAPQDPVEHLLAELWPQIVECRTAKALGAVILDAEVDRSMKFRLACLARDRLGAPWADGTLRHWLSPAYHTEERAEYVREANREASRVWQEANREHTRENSRAYYAVPENAERLRQRTRYAARGEYKKERENARRRSDHSFALSERVRSRVRKAIQAARAGKAGKTMDLLGCTPAEFKLHIESLWTEGMDWSTYGNFPGGWVVDHIVPVASFDLTTEEAQRQAFSYRNCQPMWFDENATKGSLHEGRRWRHADHA